MALAAAPLAINEHIVTLLRSDSPEVEQYRNLRYSLERSAGAEGPRIIGITSPGVGDGKTTTAINLAGVLAHRREARVLLIDADLRRPSVATQLGIANDAGRPGLVDAIVDPQLSLERAAMRLASVNLWFVPPGRLSDHPFELLRAPRAGELLRDARHQFDFVVLDTSPLLLVPDTRVLESWIDAFLLVVAAHRTPRRLLQESLNVLSPSKVFGLVFNADDRPLSGYDGYYQRYGYSAAAPDPAGEPTTWR